jgi:hypothetical protein
MKTANVPSNENRYILVINYLIHHTNVNNNNFNHVPTHHNNFNHVPADGTRGGILLAWKGTVCRVINSRIDTYSISVQIESAEGSPWWFTGVYDPNLDNLKILQELHNVCAACAGPWVVGATSN